ncbi:hypothetical protein [Streptomyces sp. H27-C3]|uniref:hypothetical protein n=1 Tax=Streptomyces sp. H27-C3 TaxID=3046305 RepID=UPI0024BA09C4|nr:hypothetical protein [Streptomyces sp. H27-C3]MDJ0467041.1 hypothetical protein [Streptomyces sp. H27-C3]
MMWPDPPTAAATAGALAVVAGYWAGSAHLLDRTERVVDRWARKHAVRRGFGGRRHLGWWLAQVWFAAQIAYNFVLAPVASVRNIREVREARRQYRLRRQSAPPVLVADVPPADTGRQQAAQQ